MAMNFSKSLSTEQSPIPGLFVLELPVHGDNRGWFKENWHREKMRELGLGGFAPVQNNISFNEKAGTTRGIHAEPWDKFVSVATGRIFGAWVDLRAGENFGKVFTTYIDPSRGVFIPRGVGNAFQTLEDDTSYAYLVNDHWSAEAQAEYTFLNLEDESVNIPWPIALDQAELSDKDRNHPRLSNVVPMLGRKKLVLGADGQLGLALRNLYDGETNIEFLSREEFDITDEAAYMGRNWKKYDTIINAAAYTAVDDAETSEGRLLAWRLNVNAVALLARVATENDLTLVHVSSDYVFDGTQTSHSESESFSPLGVYGQSKAAGDAVASTVPKHYIARTSWVIGEGKNFVTTMASLAGRGVSPNVVNDQFGRLTFAQDLAESIRHLLETNAPFGTYNVTNDGPAQSWSDIAKIVYELVGADASDVTCVSTAEYYSAASSAPRPLNSLLDLRKIKSVGFFPETAQKRLTEYLTR